MQSIREWWRTADKFEVLVTLFLAMLTLIILPYAVWLGRSIVELQAQVRENRARSETRFDGIEARFDDQGERLDQFANRLGEAGMRVASDELQRPFEAAVITTTPFEFTSGESMRLVHVLDVREGRRELTTYTIDNDPAILIRLGDTAHANASTVSVQRFEAYSRAVGDNQFAPDYIDPDLSFSIRLYDPEAFGWLKAESRDRQRVELVGTELNRWAGLLHELEEHRDIYAQRPSNSIGGANPP